VKNVTYKANKYIKAEDANSIHPIIVQAK